MGGRYGRAIACVFAVLVVSGGTAGCVEAQRSEAQGSAPRRAEPQRTEPAAGRGGENAAYQAGDAVWVTWTGSSYRARILEVRGEEYKISYDGYDSSWDEWVPPSRIRGRIEGVPGASDGAAGGGTKARGAGSGEASYVATWECATYDYGQLNRIGGFTLRANGTYTDLNSGDDGRYTISENTIRFTSGPQRTDAPVRYQPEARSGAGMIVFDYGGGARLDCYRAR